MYTPHDYPFACSYLGHLLKHKKIANKLLLLEHIKEMEDWISANLTLSDGTEEWMWSDKKGRTTQCGIFTWEKVNSTFVFFHPITNLEIRISRFIFFKREEDLLAFKMRFGIFREYSSNGCNGNWLV